MAKPREVALMGQLLQDSRNMISASAPVADGSIALLLDPLAYHGLLAPSAR
jgi:hypothetical protein